MSIINFIRRHAEENFILASLILLIVFFGIASENFFSVITLTTILNQLPALTVVTVGMTFVLIVAGIDLSVGSVLGFSAAVVGVAAIGWGMPLPIACLLGVGVGIICGAVNGILVSYFSLPSFIVTLGMLEMARGLAYVTTDSQTVYIGAGIQRIALPLPGIGVSAALIFSLLLVVAAHFLLTRTVFGRYITAIGTNQKAARMSGIDTRPYLLGVLAVSGGLAGLGGVFNAAYLGSADPNAGIGLELSAIAAAVIGGTSLMGGRGSIIGAFAGVLIISVLQNGLAQIGVSEPAKRLITGAVIIIAVLIDRWRAQHKQG
ncbi:MAG: ABC transporter permease [Gammaproteobacteria bacterium]|nr:MAG: ABC transporter permease [Gammaproteobacteria bacterium]RLA35942.1 MAG: ABC transporter permease [Gammaproteobacteria bacterium]